MPLALTGSLAALGLLVGWPQRAAIVRAFDRMSYGLLMDGTKPIRVGDILKHPDATR